MSRVRYGVVGVGHLGQAHARIASEQPDIDLVGIVDVCPEQAATVAERHGVQPYSNFRALIPHVEAAVIAVPTTYHFEVAREFLEAGVSLLIEKPITTTVKEADALVALAERTRTVVQVGHVERFNPAFEELERSPLQPKFIQAERMGPFSGRSTDVGVVHDLMIHDLDLILTLVRSEVTSVSALGWSVLGGHEDIAQAQIGFANGCVAQVSASRVHHEPSRVTRLWGPEGSAILDMGQRRLRLTQPVGPLRQPGFDVRRLDPTSVRAMRTELFDHYLQSAELDCSGGDQLTAEIREFVNCVRTGATPRVDGQAGRDALVLAERVLESIDAHAWSEDPHGPRGARNLPTSRGWLISNTDREAA